MWEELPWQAANLIFPPENKLKQCLECVCPSKLTLGQLIMWVSEMGTASVTRMKSLSAAYSIFAVVFTGLVLLFKDLGIIYARGEGKNISRSVTPEIRVWQKKQIGTWQK